jgi:anaerobic magnesium-protoporphyrin IX monomethyl ester cyclase
MRITFVGIGWEQPGVGLLSALAKRSGHQVRLAFSVSLFNDRFNFQVPYLARLFDDRASVLKTIEEQKPDVLAFSAITSTYQWMLGIATDAKGILPGVKTVFGGIHPSAVPDRVLNHPAVDYVCVGEGDEAFPLILTNIGGGSSENPIANTRYKLKDGRIVRGPQVGFFQNLDSLPFQDKTIWEDHIRIRDVYYTSASRGCPYRCAYCFNSFIAHLPECSTESYIRRRSVEHVIAELRAAHQRYSLKFVDFEDDIFTFDRRWLNDFLTAYRREINVPFVCFSHPKFVDEEVARWLHEAGCQYVMLGVESFADEYRKEIIKRQGSRSEVERALESLNKNRIRVKVDHLLGLPGEPPVAQETAREVYLRHRPFRVQTFWTNLFPGTELFATAKEQGILSATDVEMIEDGRFGEFYRRNSTIVDKELLKTYKTYELIFKLIPILPTGLVRKLNPQILRHFPLGLCSAITFILDVLHGLVSRDPDHLGYARHYLIHLFRLIRVRFGFNSPTAEKNKAIKQQDLSFVTPINTEK